MTTKENLKAIIAKNKSELKEKYKEEGDIDITEIRDLKKKLKRSQRKMRSLIAREEKEKIKKEGKKKKEEEKSA